MKGWLTVAEAAERVGKSTDTIYRWSREGLFGIWGGLVPEEKLLKADAYKRQRIGRPRAARVYPKHPDVRSSGWSGTEEEIQGA